MTENNKEKLSEMEQIHRGLEEFLEKEVYEEYETLQGDGTGTGEAYGDWEDAGASEKGTTQRQAEKGAGASQKGQDMSKA